MATYAGIAGAMLELVPRSLRPGNENLASQIEEAFPPVRTKPLPLGHLFNYDICSCDGYYETTFVPGTPWILYRDDVSAGRVCFTLLHELGHHLVQSVEPALLDDIDQLAGPDGDPLEVEELLCNEFAGRVLIPKQLVADLVDGALPVPRHLELLHERSGASWEAAAVRLAQQIPGYGAVLLLREQGCVAFAAPSPTLRSSWPRGSPVAPNGPLARALRIAATAGQDVYRWNLPGARQLWCDTRPTMRGLGVALLADRPSNRALNVIEEVEPAWKRESYCRQCNELRSEGWCDECRGPRCPTCGACGCRKPLDERRCPGCGLMKSVTVFADGSNLCRDCL
jgi:hypothetical protein